MTATQPETTRSLVPARMDRLPWSRFHTSVVIGLGISWILDGLEIQLVSSAGFQETLGMSTADVTLAATIYLAGQVCGALFFGRLTDRLGRKKLFILTLAIYLIGSGLAGLAFAPWFLYVFRFIAGAGIGGEYTAINAAIDELIPSHYRGHVDIAINGTYWAGAGLGALANVFLLNPDLVPTFWGWRIGFFIGPFVGLIIIYLRRHIPESPRWLMTHGRHEEAEGTVTEIEERVEAAGHRLDDVGDDQAISIKGTDKIPFRQLVGIFVHTYPRRTVLGLSMMITQAFLYNAIFFTYILVLKNFYGVSTSNAQYYFFPFAIGNLLGPLLLGRLFDTIGRRKMIFATYGVAGVVLGVSAALFHAGVLSALTQTILWCVAFFFASAGASSAYLTVSEIFPLEIRGQAISYFFIVAQATATVVPLIYGLLIGDGSDRGPLSIGYAVAALIMVAGGVVALVCGVNAERQSLEDVADPLTKVTEEAAA